MSLHPGLCHRVGKNKKRLIAHRVNNHNSHFIRLFYVTHSPRARNPPAQHGRIDPQRRQHRYPNALLVVGNGQPFGEPDNGVFRDRIWNVARSRQNPRHRRRMQQIPFAALEHPWQHRPHRVYMRHHIDIPLRLPDIHSGFKRIATRGNTGIAIENLYWTKVFFGVPDQRVNRGFITYVTRDSKTINLTRDRRGTVPVDVSYHHLCTLMGKCPRGRGSNAACSAGNHSYTFVQFHSIQGLTLGFITFATPVCCT